MYWEHRTSFVGVFFHPGGTPHTDSRGLSFAWRPPLGKEAEANASIAWSIYYTLNSSEVTYQPRSYHVAAQHNRIRRGLAFAWAFERPPLGKEAEANANISWNIYYMLNSSEVNISATKLSCYSAK